MDLRRCPDALLTLQCISRTSGSVRVHRSCVLGCVWAGFDDQTERYRSQITACCATPAATAAAAADICQPVAVHNNPTHHYFHLETQGLFTSHELNWTPVGMHVLRTNRALTVLVSLQPVNTKHGRAWSMNTSCNWVDLLQVSAVQFGSYAVNKPLVQLYNRDLVVILCAL